MTSGSRKGVVPWDERTDLWTHLCARSLCEALVKWPSLLLACIYVYSIYRGSPIVLFQHIAVCPVEPYKKMILFSFMLKHMLSTVHVDWDPPHLILIVCCILHLFISLLCRNDNERNVTKITKSCFRCKNNACHVASNYFITPEYLTIIVNRLDA